MYYVYILRCHDETLYTGITTDIPRRFEEHLNDKNKGAKYTRSHKPKYIEAAWSCNTRSLASRLEIFIKKLSKKSKVDIIDIPEKLDELYREKYSLTQTELFEYIKEFRKYHIS